MPISPPISDSTIASTRNCSRTWRSVAPTASRMPISRVRSVTDTSMMFMMPMPPTSRLTAATAESRPVSTLVIPVSIEVICFMSKTLKSSSSKWADAASFAHQAFDVGFALFGRDAGPDRGIDHRHVLVAGNPALEGPDRYQNDIVLVGAEARGSLDVQNADHPAGYLLEPYARADRIAIAEQFLSHGVAEMQAAVPVLSSLS
jgi:hypothetical protein